MLTKLSTASRYGLRALKYLAQNPGPRSVAEISQAEKISKTYLEKIFNRLQKGGVITASRGAQGGYILNKKPARISLLEVFNILENQTSSQCHLSNGGSCTCGLAGCTVGALENQLENLLLTAIKKITLRDLL